jgi:aminoglycoside phosphotransferase (APT) family kinase protein
MSVFIDPDRLLLGLRRSVRNKVMPALPQGTSAAFGARAIHELLVHTLHRRASRLAPPDPEAASHMAETIRRLTAAAVGDQEAARLVAILHDDSRWYREDYAAFKADLAAAGAETEQVFELPAEEQLTRIMRARTGDEQARAIVVDQAVGGYSKQTVFFDHTSGAGTVQRLVMRRDLPFAQERSSVTSEFPVLKAVHARGLPVAEPLFVESDPAVLGTPFLVSRRVPGRLMGDSLGLAMPADFDAAAALGGLLARLHGIDPAGFDIPGISDVAVDLASQQALIDAWTRKYRESIDIPSAAIEIGLAWLRANADLVAGERVLVHGDVGYHNILFDEGRLMALVDWELVHVGNPAEDLAYVSLYIDRPVELIDHYVAAGGRRPSEGAMTWCRVFGSLRNALYGVIGMRQFNEGRHDDVSMLPIILGSYAAYVDALDKSLSEIILARGFRWGDEP